MNFIKGIFWILSGIVLISTSTEINLGNYYLNAVVGITMSVIGTLLLISYGRKTKEEELNKSNEVVKDERQ